MVEQLRNREGVNLGEIVFYVKPRYTIKRNCGHIASGTMHDLSGAAFCKQCLKTEILICEFKINEKHGELTILNIGKEDINGIITTMITFGCKRDHIQKVSISNFRRKLKSTRNVKCFEPTCYYSIMVGKRYGQLTFLHTTSCKQGLKSPQMQAMFRCDCGNEEERTIHSVTMNSKRENNNCSCRGCKALRDTESLKSLFCKPILVLGVNYESLAEAARALQKEYNIPSYMFKRWHHMGSNLQHKISAYQPNFGDVPLSVRRNHDFRPTYQTISQVLLGKQSAFFGSDFKNNTKLQIIDTVQQHNPGPIVYIGLAGYCDELYLIEKECGLSRNHKSFIIDRDKIKANAVKANFLRLGYSNIEGVAGEMNELLPELIKKTPATLIHYDAVGCLTVNTYATVIETMKYTNMMFITVQGSSERFKKQDEGRVKKGGDKWYVGYEDGVFPFIPGIEQLWSTVYTSKRNINMWVYCIKRINERQNYELPRNT